MSLLLLLLILMSLRYCVIPLVQRYSSVQQSKLISACHIVGVQSSMWRYSNRMLGQLGGSVRASRLQVFVEMFMLMFWQHKARQKAKE